MTLKVKKDGAWKEASSLKVKINGEWKDVSTLYSKKDGAWVTVYSSGALITFTNYPYPIPVAKGWKYSTDKTNWTTVTSDSTINTSGKFTGYVKAKGELTLSNFYTTHTSAKNGARIDGTNLSNKRYLICSFVNNWGYVCGGFKSTDMQGQIDMNDVDKYDQNGVKSTGTPLSQARCQSTAFTLGSKGYVCGGYKIGDTARNNIDIFDASGNITTSRLPYSVGQSTSFVNGDCAYICGGISYKYPLSAVCKIDLSGNMTYCDDLNSKRPELVSFVIGSKGYVCGGGRTYYAEYPTDVNVYDQSGVKTNGTPLSQGRVEPISFVNNWGYVCGGYIAGEDFSSVERYDSSGNRSSGTSMSEAKTSTEPFVYNSRAYICGGRAGDRNLTSKVVNVYNSSGNRSTGTSLKEIRGYMTTFVLASRGYVCGGQHIYNSSSGSDSNYVEIYYDQPESYSTKLPITAGSTYTLNGNSGVASKSQVLSYTTRVSGTISYKTGTAPSS